MRDVAGSQVPPPWRRGWIGTRVLPRGRGGGAVLGRGLSPSSPWGRGWPGVPTPSGGGSGLGRGPPGRRGGAGGDAGAPPPVWGSGGGAGRGGGGGPPGSPPGRGRRSGGGRSPLRSLPVPVPPAVPPSAAAAAPASAPPLSALGSREPPAPPPRPAAAAPSAAIRHRNFPAPAPHGTRRGGGGPGAARGCSGAPGPPRPRLGPARRRPAGGRLGAAAPHKLLCPRRGECAGPGRRARGGGAQTSPAGVGLAGGSGRPHAPPAAGALEGQVPNCPRGSGWGAARSLQAEQYPEGAAPQSAGAWGGCFVLGSGRRPASLGRRSLCPRVPFVCRPWGWWAKLRRRGLPRGGGEPHSSRAPAGPPRTGWPRGGAPWSECRARPRGCSVSEAQKLSRKSEALPSPRPEREDRAGGDFGVWGSPLGWRALHGAAWGGCRPVAPGLGGGVTPDSRPGPCSRRDFPHWGPVLGTGWGCVFGCRWLPGM